jgi:hypothetical protein
MGFCAPVIKNELAEYSNDIGDEQPKLKKIVFIGRSRSLTGS